MNIEEVNLVNSQSCLDDENDLDIFKPTEPQSHSFLNNLWSNKFVFYSLLGFSSLMGGTLFGYDLGIISGALLKITEEYNYNCFDQSLIVSFVLLGAAIGSIGGGVLLDWIGRKRTLLLNCIVNAIGIGLASGSNSLVLLLIGRLLIGFSIALAAMGECLLLSELSSVNHRGKLISCNELGITNGFLLAFLVSFLFSSSGPMVWRVMFALGVVPSALQFFTLLLLPRSPRFLLMKNLRSEAQEILKIIQPDFYEQEIANICSALEQEKSRTCCDLVSKKGGSRIRLTIGLGLVIFQQLSGQPNIMYYAPVILRGMGYVSTNSATLSTFAIGLVKFLSTALSLCLIDRIGRRILLLVGCCLMCVSMASIALLNKIIDLPKEDGGNEGICSTWSQQNHSTESSSVINQTTSSLSMTLLLIAFMVDVAAYSLSFGTVTWVLLSEIFPICLRGRAFALTNVVNWTVNFAVSFSFLNFINLFGTMPVFLFYSLSSLAGAVFTFFLIPETKGKSLEAIGRIFDKDSTA